METLLPASLPEMRTSRLLLRQITMADAPALFELRSNPDVMRYIPRVLATQVSETEKQIHDILHVTGEKAIKNWTITLLGNDTLIGLIGFYRMRPENLRAEVGYMLSPTYHNQGIMNEALQPIIQYGFETMKLHTLEAVIDPGNIASEKLLLKNNFVKEAHFKENIFFDGRFSDSAHYTLFRSL